MSAMTSTPSEYEHTLVEVTEELLPLDGSLLQLQRLLGHPTVLREMLPLEVSYLFQ